MTKATYKIVASGLLIAISIVLTRIFSFTFPVLNFPASRLSIGFLPIMLAGMMFGPGWGFAVGALADLIGFMLTSSSLPYSPLITIVSGLVGLFSSLLYRYSPKGHKVWRVIITISITLITCSMFLQTYALYRMIKVPYWTLLVARLPVILASIPVYCVAVYYINLGLERARLFPSGPAGQKG